MMSPPSFAWRASVAVTLLVTFYLVTFGIALSLFAVPFGVLYTGRINGQALFVCLLCWVASILLMRGVLQARPRRFKAPGRKLEREDAEPLFAMLEELAARAGTAPPTQVYLTLAPDLAVTETSGLFRRGERVLIVGAPLLATVTKSEIRAGLAHELGHFVGGDTRLVGVVRYTFALFESVLESTERTPFADQGRWLNAAMAFTEELGRGIVTVFAKLNFFLTAASSRKQEVCADALAAKLAGRRALAGLLEKAVASDIYWPIHLRSDVLPVMDMGAIPVELTEGFRAFVARFPETRAGMIVQKSLFERKVSPYDTHPPIADRLRFLESYDDGPEPDTTPALELLTFDAEAREHFLVHELMKRTEATRGLKMLPWEDIARDVVRPQMGRHAQKLAAQLFSMFPSAQTLIAMWLAVEDAHLANGGEAVAIHVEPRLPHVHPRDRGKATVQVLFSVRAALLEGALLEAGAQVLPSLGEPCTALMLSGEKVLPQVLVWSDAEEDRLALENWRTRLRTHERESTKVAP